MLIKPALQNHITKNALQGSKPAWIWLELRLQLQTIDYCKMKAVVMFMFSLETVTFYLKKITILLYNPKCGLLCLLSYLESINSHS